MLFRCKYALRHAMPKATRSPLLLPLQIRNGSALPESSRHAAIKNWFSKNTFRPPTIRKELKGFGLAICFSVTNAACPFFNEVRSRRIVVATASISVSAVTGPSEWEILVERSPGSRKVDFGSKFGFGQNVQNAVFEDFEILGSKSHAPVRVGSQKMDFT